MNIPDKMFKVLCTFYRDPQFRIKTPAGKSDYKRQNAGIRQGCPLSPYLFIIGMTVMLHDIYDRINSKVENSKPVGFCHANLLFADDTLLITRNTRAMNILIKEIETESAKYNMNLNKHKCEFIASGNYTPNVYFTSGQKLKQVADAKYLGGNISNTSDASKEISKRIGLAVGVFKKLNAFWKKSACSKKFRIIVFNAGVMSILLYGLETIPLTKM